MWDKNLILSLQRKIAFTQIFVKTCRFKLPEHSPSVLDVPQMS